MEIDNRNRWRGASTGDRLKAFNEIFVKHEGVKRVITYLESELPIRDSVQEGTGLLVIAPSGAGKTSLIRYLGRVYPNEESAGLSKRPVVAMTVPQGPTPKSMGEALLQAMGDPLCSSGSAGKKMKRAAVLLPKLGTLFVAIDNFQDVPANRMERGVKQIAYWLRDLCDIHFGGVVGAFGTEDAALVRDSHPELRRRMQARIEISHFGMESPRDRKCYLDLLKLLDNALPLAESSDLDAAATAARLHLATRGNLDYLMKLLRKSMVCAAARGGERIEMLDLERAFELQHQAAAELGNPFSEGHDGEQLCKPGQVFGLAPQAAPLSNRPRRKSA